MADVTLTADEAAFLSARLRRLFKHFGYQLPEFTDASDASLIRVAGSAIGGLLLGRTDGVTACNCAARLAGRVDGNVHFEGCPHFAPPNDALRRALGDIISQTVVAERMGYTDPQDWQEKFQRVRQIARDALGVPAVEAPSIPATWQHDAGAYARCSFCLRYTRNTKALSHSCFLCDCGSAEGWSGSFEPPGPRARWLASDGVLGTHEAQPLTVNFEFESMTPLEGMDRIYAEYAKTFGRYPDAFMAQVVGQTKEDLFIWWGAHREKIRAALAAFGVPVTGHQTFSRQTPTGPKDE